MSSMRRMIKYVFTMMLLTFVISIQVFAEKSVPVTNIRLFVKQDGMNQSSIFLSVGKTFAVSKIKADIYPGNATNKKYTLRSSDSSIMTIKNNKLKAVKEGIAHVIVNYNNGKNKREALTVYVLNPKSHTLLTPTKKIVINGESVSIGLPNNKATNYLYYGMEDPTIASGSWDADGNTAVFYVDGLKVGNTKCLLYTGDKSRSATIKITVKKPSTDYVWNLPDSRFNEDDEDEEE